MYENREYTNVNDMTFSVKKQFGRNSMTSRLSMQHHCHFIITMSTALKYNIEKHVTVSTNFIVDTRWDLARLRSSERFFWGLFFGFKQICLNPLGILLTPWWSRQLNGHFNSPYLTATCRATYMWQSTLNSNLLITFITLGNRLSRDLLHNSII